MDSRWIPPSESIELSNSPTTFSTIFKISHDFTTFLIALWSLFRGRSICKYSTRLWILCALCLIHHPDWTLWSPKLVRPQGWLECFQALIRFVVQRLGGRRCISYLSLYRKKNSQTPTSLLDSSRNCPSPWMYLVRSMKRSVVQAAWVLNHWMNIWCWKACPVFSAPERCSIGKHRLEATYSPPVSPADMRQGKVCWDGLRTPDVIAY